MLCLTRGEASSVHGVAGDLATLRESEFREAAHALGVETAILRERPDGELEGRVAELAADVVAVASDLRPAGLLVFDPSGVTGHPDHAAATAGVECRKDADVIDETPAAYKSIDAVMEAQRDLVEIVYTLRQVLCVKG